MPGPQLRPSQYDPSDADLEVVQGAARPAEYDSQHGGSFDYDKDMNEYTMNKCNNNDQQITGVYRHAPVRKPYPSNIVDEDGTEANNDAADLYDSTDDKSPEPCNGSSAYTEPNFQSEGETGHGEDNPSPETVEDGTCLRRYEGHTPTFCLEHCSSPIPLDILPTPFASFLK